MTRFSRDRGASTRVDSDPRVRDRRPERPSGLWRPAAILLAAVWLVYATPAKPPPKAGQATAIPKVRGADLKILSGEPRLLVINGDATSYHWPAILQKKLDRHFGDQVVKIKSATQGSSPIARWMDVKTGKRRMAWKALLKTTLSKKGSQPAIVLCQQSLQMAFGKPEEGIRGKDDTERINQGADIYQKFAEMMMEDGADLVFVSTNIYKPSMEPAIGNERLALAELLERKRPRILAGPDVWQLTRRYYPEAYTEDGLYPNPTGSAIMAQAWFETLLKHDGLEIPKWSREELRFVLQQISQKKKER